MACFLLALRFVTGFSIARLSILGIFSGVFLSLAHGCTSDDGSRAGSVGGSGGTNHDTSVDTNGCSSGPSGCCCQLDVIKDPVCTGGKWQCPAGYDPVSKEQCIECPGPCCISGPPPPDASDDADASDADIDASDAQGE